MQQNQGVDSGLKETAGWSYKFLSVASLSLTFTIITTKKPQSDETDNWLEDTLHLPLTGCISVWTENL